MKPVQFTATMHKYEKQAEKTGWTYIEVPPDLAQKLKPGNKKEFKVKGKLDSYTLKRVSLIPVGGGRFIMPVNAAMRKAIGKRHGAMVKLQLTEDKSEFVFNNDFLECLADEPSAKKNFSSLPGSHQRYFSKWIDDAKTETTRTKRIAMAVNALSRGFDFGRMLREAKKEKEELGK
jgi:hypothetical protein